FLILHRSIAARLPGYLGPKLVREYRVAQAKTPLGETEKRIVDSCQQRVKRTHFLGMTYSILSFVTRLGDHLARTKRTDRRTDDRPQPPSGQRRGRQQRPAQSRARRALQLDP